MDSGVFSFYMDTTQIYIRPWATILATSERSLILSYPSYALFHLVSHVSGASIALHLSIMYCSGL